MFNNFPSTKMKIMKILFGEPNLGGRWIVNKLALKNIDLIIAVIVIGLWFYFWNVYFKEVFAIIINSLFPNAYGVSRTRVLSEYFILAPTLYILGYFHFRIKQELNKSREITLPSATFDKSKGT